MLTSLWLILKFLSLVFSSEKKLSFKELEESYENGMLQKRIKCLEAKILIYIDEFHFAFLILHLCPLCIVLQRFQETHYFHLLYVLCSYTFKLKN